MMLRIPALAAVVALVACTSADAQVIFTDSFDTDTSANYAITSDSVDVEDTASGYIEFGFDYSATGSSRLTTPIGAAPGGGSTTGMLIAANLTGGNRSSINVFPIIAGQGLATDPDTGLPVIADNYRMSFDFWAGVNDIAGTSEYLQIGAQSDGDGTHINGFGEAAPDSDFFEINTNGDLSGSDVIAFTTLSGTPTTNNSFQEGAFLPHQSWELQTAFPTSAGYTGEDRFNNADIAAAATGPGTGLLQSTPSNSDGLPDGGAPGEVWSTAAIEHIDGVTTLFLNNVEIGSIEFSDFANDSFNPNGPQSGIPFVGYSDFFGSQAGGDSTLVAEGPGTVFAAPVDGDYNGDGTVNAADYTVWRDGGSPDSTAAGYTLWETNFGEGAASGGTNSSFDPFNASFVIIDNLSVETLGAPASVPEPASVAVAAMACLAFAGRRRG